MPVFAVLIHLSAPIKGKQGAVILLLGAVRPEGCKPLSLAVTNSLLLADFLQTQIDPDSGLV